MIKNNFPEKAEDVGFRFILFRKAIKKTRSQLALESGIRQSRIAAVEKGRGFPEINFLHFLKKKYGLNINWLLCKEGDMFVSSADRPSEVDADYAMKPPAQKGEVAYKEHLEFFQLLQVPAIEKVIMKSLEEVKEKLRAEAGKEK